MLGLQGFRVEGELLGFYSLSGLGFGCYGFV